MFSGVRLEACEVVEEAQRRGVELSGGRGDDRHEPVVLSLKPVVVLGHLGAVGPVGRVLVAGVLGASTRQAFVYKTQNLFRCLICKSG